MFLGSPGRRSKDLETGGWCVKSVQPHSRQVCFTRPGQEGLALGEAMKSRHLYHRTPDLCRSCSLTALWLLCACVRVPINNHSLGVSAHGLLKKYSLMLLPGAFWSLKVKHCVKMRERECD